MRIGIISGFVGGGGGIERTFVQIIKSLKDKHDLTLYTLSKPTIRLDEIRIKSKIPLKIPIFGLYQRMFESVLISDAKDEDLLIEVSGGFAIPDGTTRDVVVYCHGDFQDKLLSDSKYRGVWAWYYKPYERATRKFLKKINRASIHVISNSDYVRSDMVKLYGKDSTTIYPPVSVQEFDPGSKKSPKIATISRYSSEKGLVFSMDVMSDMDHDYHIIGNTMTWANTLYYARLTRKFKKYPNILLEKNVPRSHIVRTLNESKVYFSPSHETFGISVIEGIAAGCIPIVPDTGAHKEIVPISDLRYPYGDVARAREKLDRAVKGRFDHHLKPLQDHIVKFDERHFQSQFQKYISAVTVPPDTARGGADGTGSGGGGDDKGGGVRPRPHTAPPSRRPAA